MPPAGHESLGRRERQIMDVVYRLGRAAVADVMRELPDPPTYSAVRAMLRYLERKGHLRHSRDGARYVYEPTVSHSEAQRTALRHLVRTFFRGSRPRALAALLDLPWTGFAAWCGAPSVTDGDVSFVPAPALLKIALLVLAALLAAAALHRTPAEARHDLWLLVVTGSVVLGLAGLLLPAVYFAVPGSWAPFAQPTRRGAELIALVWTAGAVVAGLRFVAGLVALRRIRVHATALRRADAPVALAAASRLAGLARPVTLLVSTEVHVPVTWGVRRPVVALPAAAAQWSGERLRLVLLHELLHVRRRDVLVECFLEAVTVAF